MLTHFNVVPAIHGGRMGMVQGMMMADRGSLKLVGFRVASVTLAEMLTTGMVVKG